MKNISESSKQVIKDSQIKIFYGFLIGILIFVIFMNFGTMSTFRIPQPFTLTDADKAVIMFIVNSPFIFVIFPLMFYLYKKHGSKMLSISDKQIEINIPLKSLKIIKWSDFDRMKLHVRGKRTMWGDREVSKFNLKFLRAHTIKQIKFLIYDSGKASQILNLLVSAADKINKHIDVTTKYL